MSEERELLEFFKAFSSADRLKIAGLLGVEPQSIVVLAGRLGLKPVAVQKHLSYLEHLELVKVKDGVYSLDTVALEAMSRRVLSGMKERYVPEEDEGEAYDRKVLGDFLQADGRLKAIPAQRKKSLVLLRHVAQVFEPGVRYTEKQVIEKLQLFYTDSTTLRRLLIDENLLARSSGGKEYWRMENP